MHLLPSFAHTTTHTATRSRPKVTGTTQCPRDQWQCSSGVKLTLTPAVEAALGGRPGGLVVWGGNSRAVSGGWELLEMPGNELEESGRDFSGYGSDFEEDEFECEEDGDIDGAAAECSNTSNVEVSQGRSGDDGAEAVARRMVGSAGADRARSVGAGDEDESVGEGERGRGGAAGGGGHRSKQAAGPDAEENPGDQAVIITVTGQAFGDSHNDKEGGGLEEQGQGGGGGGGGGGSGDGNGMRAARSRRSGNAVVEDEAESGEDFEGSEEDEARLAQNNATGRARLASQNDDCDVGSLGLEPLSIGLVTESGGIGIGAVEGSAEKRLGDGNEGAVKDAPAVGGVEASDAGKASSSASGAGACAGHGSGAIVDEGARGASHQETADSPGEQENAGISPGTAEEISERARASLQEPNHNQDDTLTLNAAAADAAAAAAATTTSTLIRETDATPKTPKTPRTPGRGLVALPGDAWELEGQAAHPPKEESVDDVRSGLSHLMRESVRVNVEVSMMGFFWGDSLVLLGTHGEAVGQSRC
jgi:hypothetical protein